MFIELFLMDILGMKFLKYFNIRGSNIIREIFVSPFLINFLVPARAFFDTPKQLDWIVDKLEWEYLE